MLVDLKELFSSKLALFIMVLTALGLVADGVGRLKESSRQSTGQNNKPLVIKPIILPQLNESDLQQINKAYAQFTSDKSESKAKIQQGMSAVDQANQQGKLKAFFIGDNQLKLKAVIQNINKDLIALIEVNNIKSGTSNVEKFTNGNLVYGYKLVVSKNTQVTLSKQQAEKTQQIILTMYTGKV